MPKEILTTVDAKYQKEFERDLTEDGRMFMTLGGPMLDTRQGVYMICDGHEGPGQIFDETLQIDRHVDDYNIPWIVSSKAYRVDVHSEDTKFDDMKKDFVKVQEETEKKFLAKIGPGDEQLMEYAYATVFNPARRAVNGWPVAKLNQRLNLNDWMYEYSAYLNLGSSEEDKKHLAWCDAHYPLPRMVIDIDKAVQLHVDYFDATEKGQLTPEEEADYRRQILLREISIKQSMDRVVSVFDKGEGKRIQSLSGIGNGAQENNRYGARGIKTTCSDTEARIAGLKSGWPIEDLNALSSYKFCMDQIYGSAYYVHDVNPALRDKPQFKRGEQEYLGRMQKLWAKIESTTVRDNETRLALLGEMRELIQEGLEKEFIRTSELESGRNAKPYSFALADIDKKIARTLSPSELAVMQNAETYDREILQEFEEAEKNEARIRKEQAEQAEEKERRIKEEAEEFLRDKAEADKQRQTEEKARQTLEEQEREAEKERRRGLTYEQAVAEARERRRKPLSREDVEKARLNNQDAAYTWFYHLTEEKRLAARNATPINRSERPISDQDDILRYYMGKDNKTYDEALDLKLLSDEERRKLAEDYYDDLIAHPIEGVSEAEAEKNARYFGELDAQAARNLVSQPFPRIDLSDPEQVKNYDRGPLGILGTFAMDFTQNDMCFRDSDNPSSAVRGAYMSGFGTRGDYAELVGQVSVCHTLMQFARIANTPAYTPMQRAIGLHFLRKYNEELAGRPLSELSADQWIRMRGLSTAMVELINNDMADDLSAGGRQEAGNGFPKEGAPTKEQLEAFLAGGPSPFTDAYLAQFEDLILKKTQMSPADGHKNAMRQLQSGRIDMARVYNLDYIRMDGPQKRPELGELRAMSPELMNKTHRIFEQTLGNFISITGMQPTLAAARGENVYDRFTVNGRKISALMDDFYGAELMELMTPVEREIAMETILLQAFADPAHQVVFTPLNYGPGNTIVEQKPVTIPHPTPQRTAANPAPPITDAQRFEMIVTSTEQKAQKLDSIVPGVYPVFRQNGLARRLVQAEGPEQVRGARQNFMTEYAQATKDLANRVEKERPQLAAYLRLQSNIALRSLVAPMPQETLPYAALMSLVDQIHLPMPDAIDEKRPGPVFRLIADEPEKLNAFPVLEAAQVAERLMNNTAAHAASMRKAGENASAEADLKARREMLRDITILEGHLDEMERVAGMRRRGKALGQAFEDPEVVNRFVKGNPGLKVMRAELNGRRMAITNGWPAEDIELIAGFYAKREVVRQALETMPEGTEDRLAYERAGRALEEICQRIDGSAVTNTETRKQILDGIDAYGPAIYNDIAARAGLPEAGQAQALKNAVTNAKKAVIPKAFCPTEDQCLTLAFEANEMKEAARKDAKAKADLREKRVRERAEERRKAREERAKQPKAEQADPNRELTDDEIGEALHAFTEDAFGGLKTTENEALEDFLFDEVVDDAPQAEPDPRNEERKEREDLIDDVLDDAEQEALDFEQELQGGDLEFPQEEKNEEEVLDADRDERLNALADEVFYAGEGRYQTFDELFMPQADSAFYPGDEYLRMLEEDENFFGGLFEEPAQKEVGFEPGGRGNVFGFFEWPDMKERVKAVTKGSVEELSLKNDRLTSFTNDCRAYLMAAHGMNFEEAYRLNSASIEERRQYAKDYLRELETHPLNKNMTSRQREESAIYYGSLYREAIDRFLEEPFPELDTSDPEAVRRLDEGPGMVHAMGQFALDLSQDTEKLYLSGDPVVRTAYREAFGGRDGYHALSEKLYMAQAVKTMAQAANGPVHKYFPLRNKAFAKLQLEAINAKMKGKKFSDIPEGMATYYANLQNQLVTSLLPEAGAPTEQELQDYLDGKAPSPFSDEYITAAYDHLHDRIAQSVRETSEKSVAKGMKELKNIAAVYELPYIPAGPNAERPFPDYDKMPEGTLHDTKMTFDRIFGSILDAESNAQTGLSRLRGESVYDRFTVDGKKVSELPGMQDLKPLVSPEVYRIAMEGEILRAIADPKRVVTYTPLTLDKNRNAAELAPVTLEKPQMQAFDTDDFEPEYAAVKSDVSREIMKYTMGMNPFAANLSIMAGLYPGDQRLDPSAQGEVLAGEMYYSYDDVREEEMSFLTCRHFWYNFKDGVVNSFQLIHGLKEDGTLTEEGQKNYRTMKDHLNAEYDRVMQAAAEWDARNPALAEMMRMTADQATTYDRGTPWMDLNDNYSYQIAMGLTGGLHLGPAGTEMPFTQEEAMRAIQGYPTGDPKLTVPDAVIATRRMALTEAAHRRSLRAGTLSRTQDRLSRRMAMAELEEAKKKIRLVDKLYLGSFDRDGNPDVTKPELAQMLHFDRHMEETVYNATAYYPRGSRGMHWDMDAKHKLMANGWPMEDLNFIATLYTRRDDLQYQWPGMEKELPPETVRALKVLNEICGHLDHTDITNAADRQKALDFIDSYGDLLYNSTVLDGNGKHYEYRKRMAQARARQVQPHEFLDAEELKEFKACDARYQAQAEALDFVPTMNGPQTDEERSFLNAEQISRLMETYGRMEGDAAYEGSPELQQARGQMKRYAAELERFYGDHSLLDPQNAAKRRETFEKLMEQSTALVDALDEAEEHLTNDGKKTRFKPAEEKLLKDIRQAKNAVGEMRRQYVAYCEYEAQRARDMEELEKRRAEERVAEERAREAFTAPLEPVYANDGEREEKERYAVPLDYAMSMLSEQEQERLVDLLTVIPGTERFDFATGRELPPQRRQLPERVQLAYDDAGNLKPEVFLREEKRVLEEQAQKAAEEKKRAEDAVRAKRNARRLEREALEKDGFRPYDEGVKDLFADADAEFERSQREEARKARSKEREAEAIRRSDLVHETDDVRYSWSFERILKDAWGKLQTAENTRKEGEKDPALTQKDAEQNAIIETNRRKVYNDMEQAVLSSFELDEMERTLERVRPDWYRDNYLPDRVYNLRQLPPAKRYDPEQKGAVCRSIIGALPAPERQEILGVLANELPLAQREDLRERLLNVEIPTDRTYEQQVTKPLQGRIFELKQKPAIVSADGRRLTADEVKAYGEALIFADKTLDEVDPEVMKYANNLSTDRQMAGRIVRKNQLAAGREGKDDVYLTLEGQLMAGDEKLIAEGLLPVHENTMEQILHPENTYGAEYLNHLGHMLVRMEQMGMDPAMEGEQGGKLYAFEGVAQAKAAFADALRSGDPERIIETKRVYEEQRNHVEELMDYAKAHFSKTSAPTNVDNTRNPAVPWEYVQDYRTHSQVNGVYLLYSLLKRTGVSVQEFVSDPYDARRKIEAKLDESRSLRTRMKNQSIGSIMGTLMAETKMEASNRTTMSGVDDMIIGRATDALVECNPDLTVQGQNRYTDTLLSQHRAIVNKVREMNRNPFVMQDTKRASQVQQLLSIVSKRDLSRNMDRMLSGVYYDPMGRKVEPVTAEQYIASRSSFDYREIRERSADIIRDAMSVENTTFDAAAFLEERQKALMTLLTARAADAGEPGFDALEYELTHMTEHYNDLRALNHRNMPPLTAEQQQRFEENARRYEEKRKEIQKTFTNVQKNAIAARRRGRGNLVNTVRMDRLRHETRRNESEARQRAADERTEREARMRREAEENRRLEEERIRKREEAQREQQRTQERMTVETQRRIADHAVLPLTVRFKEQFQAYSTAAETEESAKALTGAEGIEARRTAGFSKLNERTRTAKLFVNMIAICTGTEDVREAAMSRDQLLGLLTTELGAQRANAIITKLPRGLFSPDNLSELTEQERDQVIGALAGAIPEKERERLIAMDDAFVPYEEMELVGSPYDAGRDPQQQSRIRDQFEKQLQPVSSIHGEIRDLKAEIYNDWAKFTNGTGTKKQRSELAAALDYAERMLRTVDPDAKDLVYSGRGLQEGYYDAKAKQSLADQLAREENSYLKNLREDPENTKGLASRPRADQTENIRRLKNEKMVFHADYIRSVAGMLRKMEEMKITGAKLGSEEGTKVYAFHVLTAAQKELKEAIRAKDRERILKATERLKEVRRGMDELMQIAEKNFHPGEYMDNLDLVRNSSIPWDYAKNAVASSQVNSIFLFGSMLKDCGISVDEFEADPGAAIQKMERITQEQLSMKGYLKGKSLGTLAADASTGYLQRKTEVDGPDANGRFFRAVEGVIMADPGASEAQRERNRFLGRQLDEYNNANAQCRANRSMGHLQRGFDSAKSTEKEREALRTLMIVDERDLDPDRMLTDPAIAPDGTAMKPFSLSAYLANRQGFDYQKQVNRTETMLKDAAAEFAELKQRKQKARTDIALSAVKESGFKPYEMLKARQEALTGLLVMRSTEREQPGYQALEQELRELPERYERLRQAEPALGLPALTKEQKRELKAGAKLYDEIANKRDKLMDAEEKRIAKEEAEKNKVYNRELVEVVDEINAKVTVFNRAKQAGSALRIESAQKQYNIALKRLEVHKKRRAKDLLDGYLAGKLPEKYVTEMLGQLNHYGQNDEEIHADELENIPVFGAKQTHPVREKVRLQERERFLSLQLLENRGYRTHRAHETIADSMLQHATDLKVPMPQGRYRGPEAPQPAPEPVVKDREGQLDALLADDEDILVGRGDQTDEEFGRQMEELKQPFVPREGGPQQNLNRQDVNEIRPGEEIGNMEAEPEQQVRRQPKRQPTVGEKGKPGVQDMDFNGLLHKMGGNEHRPEAHQRRNSVGGEQNRPQLENGQPQNGQPKRS